MKDDIVEEIAFGNLPSSRCGLTGLPLKDGVVMHRDLSDWWPEDIKDFRDDRIDNLIIVERDARERYYQKIKQHGIVVSFSGGLDSTTVLYWARYLFGDVKCLIFDYGQKHDIEVSKAVEICVGLGQQYDVVKFSQITQLVQTSLAKNCIEDVPKRRELSDIGNGIPSTFVPGRNIYFATAVAQSAYSYGYRHIVMGMNILDYSGYPDCRPEFVIAMKQAMSIGIFNGIGIGFHAPLMYLKKTEIIRLGHVLGVDYTQTHSCYNGVDGGCHECDSCILRERAFKELDI